MLQLGYVVPAADIAARLQRLTSRREVFVALTGNAIAGCVSVSLDETLVDGHVASIESFSVDEMARSQGIGAKLLAAIEVWAQEHDCDEMNVRSNVVRERAHTFYLRNGYERVKAQALFRKQMGETQALPR